MIEPIDECMLTDHEIGFKHGSDAKVQVERTIDFYTGMFQDTANLDWDKVRGVAMTYEPVMRQKWPHYLEEIQGNYRSHVGECAG